MKNISIKYSVAFFIFVTACVGVLFFFHVPKQQPCATFADGSTLCSMPKMSLYQKTYPALHTFLFPEESCFISIGDGQLDCGLGAHGPVIPKSYLASSTLEVSQ